MLKKESITQIASGDIADASNLVELALLNLNCSKEQILRYSFLTENAIARWRQSLPEGSTLCIRRKNTFRSAVIYIEAKGEKSNPLAVKAKNIKALSEERMVDNLMSGVGSELKYKYKNGTNILKLTIPKTDAENKIFKRNIVNIMLPMAFQSLLMVIAQMTDTFMLGFLDASSMSGVSVASKFVYIYNGIIMGVTTAEAIFISQYWGKRDREKINATVLSVMKAMLSISVAVSAITFFFGKEIMSLYTDLPEVIGAGEEYLHIVAFSFAIMAFANIIYAYMRATGRVGTAVAFSLIGCGVNVVLNGVLIFGLFGLPRLGVFGAAIATLSSWGVQLVLIAVNLIYKRELNLNPFSKTRTAPPKGIYKKSAPIVGQWLMWCLGINCLAAVIGHMGAAVLAADSALAIIREAVLSVCSGMGNGTGVLIGNLLGRGKFDDAWKRSRAVLGFGFKTGIAMSAFFAAASYCLRFLPMDFDGETVHYMNIIIAIYAVDVVTANINGILSNGIFFSGGDTKSVLIIDAVTIWALLVPISSFGVYSGLIPTVLLIFIAKGDGIISCPVKLWRYGKKKWLKSLVAEK